MFVRTAWMVMCGTSFVRDVRSVIRNEKGREGMTEEEEEQTIANSIKKGQRKSHGRRGGHKDLH